MKMELYELDILYYNEKLEEFQKLKKKEISENDITTALLPSIFYYLPIKEI